MYIYVCVESPQLPLNKAKNNYASFECGARVIKTNEEAQVDGGVAERERERERSLYMWE